MVTEQARQTDARNGRDTNGARAAAPGPSRGTAYRGPERKRGNGGDERLAKALGWFSIGLGATAIAAPGRIARLIGVSDRGDRRRVLRGIGVREIISGAGILTRPRPAGWLWSRVGGDAMDLSLLGRALTSDDTDRTRVTAATAAVAGITGVDVLASLRQTRKSAAMGDTAQVRQAITVNRPPADVYRFWQNFENLPRFMEHLESVQVTGPRRSHWRAKAPAGSTVEWDAEITEDRPNEVIAWRSLDGADVKNSGSVRFAPGPRGQGTVVRVEMEYSPPGGGIGATVAKLFGEEPEQQVRDDLRHFKQLIETGEITRSDATIHGRPHPAQPPKDAARSARPI